MKSSKIVLLAAVLAVLCMATASNAAVITVTYLPATSGYFNAAYGNYSLNIAGYNAPKPDKIVFLNYDIDSILAMPGASSFTVKLVYKHVSGTTQDTITVARSPSSTPDSLATNYKNIVSKVNGVFTLLGPDLCSATDDGTIGLHEVDITTIWQSWVGGEENYGVILGTSSPTNEIIPTSGLVPYLEITTPEPATMGLILVGGIAALLRRRRIA
jgi:opacity protein-like surface antigen